jgi:hypothetical protein
MKKVKEDMVQKNIELSTEFSRYLFEHPEIETSSPKMQRLCFSLTLTTSFAPITAL